MKYEDLTVWQKGLRLVKEIYQMINKIKPSRSDVPSLNPQSSILNPFQDLKEIERLFPHSIRHRTINFLPWRESLPRESRHAFFVKVVGILLFLIVVVEVMGWWMDKSAEAKKQCNERLKEKNHWIEDKIKTSQFVSLSYRRLTENLIESLEFQLKREQLLAVIEKLKSMDEDTFKMVSMEYHEEGVLIKGMAQEIKKMDQMTAEWKKIKLVKTVKPMAMSVGKKPVECEFYLTWERANARG